MTQSAQNNKRRYWLAGNRHPGQDEFFVAALDPALWQPGEQNNWDTCWYTGMPDPDVFEHLDESRVVNHIPGNNGVTIKDNLHQTLLAARQRLANAEDRARMGYFPRVFAMPDDYHELQHCAAAAPAKKWILKPKNSSRGRGIEVVRDIADVPLDDKWMVQEYIDNPHVMNDRKYVLRLYVLITSVEPLRVYLHREGFAKLASEPYNIEDPDNPFSHLTNPDVNATNTDAEAPVVFVSIGEYRRWLRAQGADDDALFAKISDLVTLTAISVREHMRQRCALIKAPTRGCYELLGVDCLVDAQLKPWILECNLSPSLEVCAAPEDGGDTERQIKSSMVADMVSLVGLNQPPASREDLAPEQVIRLDAEEEWLHRGDFERLFPAKDSAENYLRFFPVPRLGDVVSVRQITGQPLAPVKLVPSQTAEIISEDELALYFEKTGALLTPSPVAGWIWLKTAGGATPEAITAELIASHTAAHGAPDAAQEWMIRENVWDVLSNWAQLGLLRRDDGEARETGPDAGGPENLDWADQGQVQIGHRRIALAYGCPAAAARLGALLAPLVEKSGKADLSLAVQRARTGYAVTVGPRLMATGLGLDNVAQLVSRALYEQAPQQAGEVAVAGTLVPVSVEEAVLFVAAPERRWEDCAALMFSALTGSGHIGGAVLDLQKPGVAMPIGLPVRLNRPDREIAEAQLGDLDGASLQNWPSGGQGWLLPARGFAAGQDYRLRAIILADRSDGAATRLMPVSSHKALGALLVSAIGPQSARLDGSQASALNDWLGTCDLRALAFSDPQDAAAHLARALDLS